MKSFIPLLVLLSVAAVHSAPCLLPLPACPDLTPPVGQHDCEDCDKKTNDNDKDQGCDKDENNDNNKSDGSNDKDCGCDKCADNDSNGGLTKIGLVAGAGAGFGIISTH